MRGKQINDDKNSFYYGQYVREKIETISVKWKNNKVSDMQKNMPHRGRQISNQKMILRVGVMLSVQIFENQETPIKIVIVKLIREKY
jgi:hypothetical protein